MKKLVLTVAALTAVTVPLTSMAGDDSFYLKANIGVGMVLDTDVDTTDATDTATMTLDSGFVGSIAAGYDFANAFRTELELTRQKNDLDLFSSDNVYADLNDGDLKRHSVMLNGFYDVDTGSPWTPYAGVGVGWSKLDMNDPGFESSESDDVFTYQLIGGVAYAFNEQWSVDAEYRFVGTGEATIDNAEFDSNSNNLMLGLRYSF